MLSQENKVVELKYASKRFGLMTLDERKLSAYQILLKIHAITGWTIPASQLMDILIEQFELKLSESYSNVNSDEVEYAFRNRGIDVKDWGKAMNLGMIDEVMIPYLENRFEVSKTEESLKKPLMIEESKALSDEEIAEWICDWKIMEKINIELIPLMFYDFITSKGILSPTVAQKWDYATKATQNIKSMLQEAIGICKTNNAYLSYEKFKTQETDGFDKEFAGRIKNRAKRLIVYDYLKS